MVNVFFCLGLATNNGREQVIFDGVINNGLKLVAVFVISDLSGVIIINKSALLLDDGAIVLVVILGVFESGVESGVIGSMPSKLK